MISDFRALLSRRMGSFRDVLDGSDLNRLKLKLHISVDKLRSDSTVRKSVGKLYVGRLSSEDRDPVPMLARPSSSA